MTEFEGLGHVREEKWKDLEVNVGKLTPKLGTTALYNTQVKSDFTSAQIWMPCYSRYDYLPEYGANGQLSDRPNPPEVRQL